MQYSGSHCSLAGDPIVVLAADENFAMPLAATVRSALENLHPSCQLQLFVLDGGLSSTTKRRLEQSWPSGRYSVTWLPFDASVLADVPLSGHINHMTYARIVAPRLLPSTVDRVIYLDSDLIVLGDLAELWAEPLGGAWCLAVEDCAAPCMDADLVSELAACAPHLGARLPVANYRELGFEATDPYLNGGVLVLDLDAWRREDLTTQMLGCLDRHREHVRWWDQYALNVVLHGHWRALDHRWNQGATTFSFPDWSESPYDEATFAQISHEPFVVHFTTKHKPWKVTCLHPLRRLFFEYLDRTAWAGWRPSWFDSPKTVIDVMKTQQRKLRFARRRWQRRWLRRAA